MSHDASHLGPAAQLLVPQRLNVDSTVATWRAGILSLSFGIHPCVGIGMNEKSVGIGSMFNHAVDTQFDSRVDRGEVCSVAGILHIFVHIRYKTRRTVGRIVDYAFEVGTVGNATEGFRFGISVLKLCKIAEYASRRFPLSGAKDSPRHCYEHVAAPVLVEPWQAGINAVALLAGDKLVGGEDDPGHGFVERIIVRRERVGLLHQGVHSVDALTEHFLVVAAKECGNLRGTAVFRI